jgi:hypothetical protein
MINVVYKRLIPLFAVVILINLSSCSIEKKFAREFIKNDTSRLVLVIPPDLLFKTSLKDYELDNADSLDEWELDSLLYENSIFLKYVVDSVFLSNYYTKYSSELEALGFKVYNEDSLLSFLSGKPDSYIFNIAQIELEEYIMPIVEKQEFEEFLYYQVINLNAVNVNSWLEISRINEEEKKVLFFSSLFLTDELEGYFRYNYFTGNVKYDYSIDTLLLEEVYDLGELAGYLYAGYTFDFFMNLHIDKRMLEEDRYRSNIYYHYNRNKDYVLPAKEDEKFIPMEE